MLIIIWGFEAVKMSASFVLNSKVTTTLQAISFKHGNKAINICISVKIEELKYFCLPELDKYIGEQRSCMSNS